MRVWAAVALGASLVLSPSAGAESRGASEARVRAWIETVVSRVSASGATGRGRGGVAEIRLRINADGTLGGVAMEEGAVELADPVRRAVEAAAPFPPPPRSILTLEGFTELSFPVSFRVKSSR